MLDFSMLFGQLMCMNEWPYLCNQNTYNHGFGMWPHSTKDGQSAGLCFVTFKCEGQGQRSSSNLKMDFFSQFFKFLGLPIALKALK